ncbi:MAG: hypothetical protein AAFQ50_16680, partial [Pseudomonadota bacterium]
DEAAPVITTEADVPAAAPERSIRPARRPNRPTPAVAQDAPDPAPPEPQATSSDTSAEPTPEDPLADAIAGAVAEAIEQPSAQPSADPGPPLTQGEREGLRVAVSGCWVVDPGAASASVIVTLAFDMDRDGNPRTNTIRQVSASGGDGAAAGRAFEAARRAVIRCARGGYDLPIEKYEQWREIEMTFDPTTMRLR